MATNKINCPICGAEIELVPVPGKDGRVHALCGHGMGRPAPVYETDVPKSFAFSAKKTDEAKKEN